MIPFERPFGAPPVVVASMATAAGGTAAQIDVKAYNITNQKFDLALLRMMVRSRMVCLRLLTGLLSACDRAVVVADGVMLGAVVSWFTPALVAPICTALATFLVLFRRSRLNLEAFAAAVGAGGCDGRVYVEVRREVRRFNSGLLRTAWILSCVA